MSRIKQAGAMICALLILTGCAQQMADQPRVDPLDASDFFPDGQSARPLLPDTVARSSLHTDELLYTGKLGGKIADVFPFPVTDALLARGQARYDIFCSECHDRAGTGNGLVVQRGFSHPPSFHIDRLRAAPVGYLFDVITNGLRAMPAYSIQISAQDRWAIIAYVRALQLGQHAPLADVPTDQRAQLDQAGAGQGTK
jgi:mono/diheme cytochrome c family protein